jgi:CheY-like chemotaxis protein
VLIVDGDPDTLALYRAIFSPLSDEVHEAEDGAEALGKAICHRPGLIITATQLRRIDGLALCQLLRQDPATRSATIVVLTSAASPADAVRAMRAGADRVLAIPCTPEALVEVAQALCDRAAAPHQAPQPSIAGVPGEAGVSLDAAEAEPRGRSRSRMFRRETTTTPPIVPPRLHCPECDGILTFERSHTGGVNETAAEQWDYFLCQRCGPYQYRHRTRKLRPL